MIAHVSECEKLYNNITTFISRFPVKPQVILMKTFLKSSDKSDKQFSECERTMDRGEVIKLFSVTEQQSEQLSNTLTWVSRKPQSGIPKQCTWLSLVRSQRAQVVISLQVKEKSSSFQALLIQFRWKHRKGKFLKRKHTLQFFLVNIQ